MIGRQNGACACCDACKELLVAGHIHFDHVLPLAIGGTNDLNNFQALALGHHQLKTNKEATERAKADRIRQKHIGTYQNHRQREMQKILDKYK